MTSELEKQLKRHKFEEEISDKILREARLFSANPIKHASKRFRVDVSGPPRYRPVETQHLRSSVDQTMAGSELNLQGLKNIGRIGKEMQGPRSMSGSIVATSVASRNSFTTTKRDFLSRPQVSTSRTSSSTIVARETYVPKYAAIDALCPPMSLNLMVIIADSVTEDAKSPGETLHLSRPASTIPSHAAPSVAAPTEAGERKYRQSKIPSPAVSPREKPSPAVVERSVREASQNSTPASLARPEPGAAPHGVDTRHPVVTHDELHAPPPAGVAPRRPRNTEAEVGASDASLNTTQVRSGARESGIAARAGNAPNAAVPASEPEAPSIPRQTTSERLTAEDVQLERDGDAANTPRTSTSRGSDSGQPPRRRWLAQIFNPRPNVSISAEPNHLRRERCSSGSANNQDTEGANSAENSSSNRRHRRKHRCKTCPDYLVGHVHYTHTLCPISATTCAIGAMRVEAVAEVDVGVGMEVVHLPAEARGGGAAMHRASTQNWSSPLKS